MNTNDEKLVRVYSKRLNDYIEVSLEPSNPHEDQLAGVMPVMLVTDHPLSTMPGKSTAGNELQI